MPAEKFLRKKILLLLMGGLSLGFSYSLHKQWRIIKEVRREWRKINERELYLEIKRLYQSRLLERKENTDGSFTFVLTDKGKIRAITYRFDEIRIKSNNWDGKWRLVVFDVPEKLRSGRDALRNKLKELGFYELQKSVFVFPYQCEDEINFIIEFFDLRRYVRIGLLENIDNELHLKKIFKLV
jgi:DNA-binding transcriptional regulator PaaX